MILIDRRIVDRRGNVLPGVKVEVLKQGTTERANITNVDDEAVDFLVTDSDGRIYFKSDEPVIDFSVDSGRLVIPYASSVGQHTIAAEAAAEAAEQSEANASADADRAEAAKLAAEAIANNPDITVHNGSLPDVATLADGAHLVLDDQANDNKNWLYIISSNVSVLDYAAQPQTIAGGVEYIDPRTGTNALLRNVTAGATRIHQEPKGIVDDGTITKYDWMFDPFDENPTDYRILNVFTKVGATTAGGHNGQNGVAVLGVKGVGDHFGVFPSLNIGFSDDNANAVPLKVLYFDTSDTEWRTPLVGAWREGRPLNADDHVLYGGKLYKAATTGTTGATEPTHSSGTVSDGGVDLEFIRDYVASSASIKPCVVIGDRDDMPKFGHIDLRAQFAESAGIWNGKGLHFFDNADAVAWKVETGLFSDDLFIRRPDGAGLRFDAAGGFIQNTGLSWIDSAITLTGAVPSLAGAAHFRFSNGAATTVTSFSGGKPFQRFTVESTNANTTIEHGAKWILKGAADITLATDEVLNFLLNSSGTVARQV